MLPEYNAKKFHSKDATEIVLDQQIVEELEDFVQMIARLYNNNYFHNFQHAVSIYVLAVVGCAFMLRSVCMDSFSNQLLF